MNIRGIPKEATWEKFKEEAAKSCGEIELPDKCETLKPEAFTTADDDCKDYKLRPCFNGALIYSYVQAIWDKPDKDLKIIMNAKIDWT